MKDSYCVIAFGNTRVAMTVQQTLKEKGFRIDVMPTLREITAGCGLSVRFTPVHLESIRQAVGEMSIEASLCQYYKVEAEMGRCSVTRLA